MASAGPRRRLGRVPVASLLALRLPGSQRPGRPRGERPGPASDLRFGFIRRDQRRLGPPSSFGTRHIDRPGIAGSLLLVPRTVDQKHIPMAVGLGCRRFLRPGHVVLRNSLRPRCFGFGNHRRRRLLPSSASCQTCQLTSPEPWQRLPRCFPLRKGDSPLPKPVLSVHLSTSVRKRSPNSNKGGCAMHPPLLFACIGAKPPSPAWCLPPAAWLPRPPPASG